MFTEFIKFAPQLGFGIIFIVALWILFKEYRSIHAEMDSKIVSAVDTHIGALFGRVQTEAAKATNILNEITDTQTQVSDASNSFIMLLDTKTNELNRALTIIDDRLLEVEQKLSIAEANVPIEKNLPLSDLAALAKSADTLQEALHYIHLAMNDKDVTSAELELLGDTARKFGKHNLAFDLYKRAIAKDSGNVSAQNEYYCLQAEVKSDTREEALSKAYDLVFQHLDHRLWARLGNALMQLKRFDEFGTVAKKLLEIAEKQQGRGDLITQLHRDLAVTYIKTGLLDEADIEFAKALEHGESDENVLKAYISFLLKRKEYSKAKGIVIRLLHLDPLDTTYYLLFAKTLEGLEDYENAIQWYEKAIALQQDGPMRAQSMSMLNKAVLRAEWSTLS